MGSHKTRVVVWCDVPVSKAIHKLHRAKVREFERRYVPRAFRAEKTAKLQQYCSLGFVGWAQDIDVGEA